MYQFYIDESPFGNRLKVDGSLPKNPDTALDISIEKWQVIVDYLENHPLTTVYNLGDTCALCLVYIDEENEDHEQCVGCPVSENTGRDLCQGTPWRDETDLQYARAELEFLRNLK